jgi:hypothetical protein
MQKFPLRMKDNDLLVTELYRDPTSDPITAISVYLTPKTSEIIKIKPFPRLISFGSGLCGNWIEIAYGTSAGTVRVIVQHPETVGHGPQLFQTFTVHQSPVTKVMQPKKRQFIFTQTCYFVCLGDSVREILGLSVQRIQSRQNLGSNTIQRHDIHSAWVHASVIIQNYFTGRSGTQC